MSRPGTRRDSRRPGGPRTAPRLPQAAPSQAAPSQAALAQAAPQHAFSRFFRPVISLLNTVANRLV
ncbi:hypothetical protein ABT381_30980, partial [Streptomyces sp. NPDC000151]|uniref:hypothetical protein n=1 Tax=Streptomyces sp. NPDC000151 TaxID=3154244 RepID=UPI0033231663